MCVDSDWDVFDSQNKSCKYYRDTPEACDSSDKYDDDDFSSGDLCCMCGGGCIPSADTDCSRNIEL